MSFRVFPWQTIRNAQGELEETKRISETCKQAFQRAVAALPSTDKAMGVAIKLSDLLGRLPRKPRGGFNRAVTLILERSQALRPVWDDMRQAKLRLDAGAQAAECLQSDLLAPKSVVYYSQLVRQSEQAVRSLGDERTMALAQFWAMRTLLDQLRDRFPDRKPLGRWRQVLAKPCGWR